MRKTSKRARAADSFAPAARASSRVAGLPPLNYDADADGDQGPVLASVAERAFWDQWDTDLLWTWIADYKRPDIQMTAKLKKDREALLNILVEGAWVQRPAVGIELEVLVKVWKKISKPHPADDAPGRVVRADPPEEKYPVPRERAADEPASKANNKKKGKRKASSPPATPVELSDDDDDDGRGLGRQESFSPIPQGPMFSPIPLGPFGAQGPQGHMQPAAPPLFVKCPHCTCKNPGAEDLSFVCVVCDLIAALAPDHPANVARLAKVSGPRAPTAAAAAAASSSSSAAAVLGQLPADMFEGSTVTKLREKELREWAKLPAHPSFDAMAVGAVFPHTSAFEAGRNALQASAYEAPSDLLLQVIREGKLARMGFAKPRLISDSLGRQPATMSWDAATSSLTTTAPNATPKIDSVEDFAFTLVSTILPALIDRPRALAEWLALGRTALEIYSTNGKNGAAWAMASAYLEQLLTERTYSRKPYNDVGLNILTNTVFAVKMSQQSQHGARGPMGPGPMNGGNGKGFCSDYNWRQQGCSRGADCIFKHECQFGHMGCTQTTQHKSSQCPFKVPMALKGAGGAGQGGRSRGKGGGGRGDAASVRTAQSEGANKAPKA